VSQQNLQETAQNSDDQKPDEAFIHEALSHANANVLRIALYQQTRDPELAEMKVETYTRDGSPVALPVLTKDAHSTVIEKAVEYLMQPEIKLADPPTYEEAKELMEMFEGESQSEAAAQYGFEDLAFDGFPRYAEWKNKPSQEKLDDFEVTIIGAGFSAIIAAIQLRHLGIKYRIIERQPGFGGTWCLNDYPEARVDISTFLYQFKFERNYPWKHFFAPREELIEYIDCIVDKYDIRSHATFDTKITEAKWDEASKKWVLTTEEADGNTETITSNVVFSASGLFSTAKLPDIPGIDDYEGKMFHTTEWDHSYDYSGKRVALIGTGSTGSQLAPAIAEAAGSFTIYQRTPNWVTPIPNYRGKVPPGKRWLLDNMPGYANWFGYSHHTGQCRMQPMHVLDREWQAKGGLINEKNDMVREGLIRMIRKKMGDRTDLAEKLIPDFAPMSRRLVVDNGWYDCVLRDNVELVTNGIETFTPKGIIDNEGVVREYDLVILAAGFQVERYLWPVKYVGRDGAQLEDLWEKDGARAHLTMTMPGYPNFFMFYGPNAGARAGSFHSWMENVSRYMCEVVINMLERDAQSVEVKREVYEDYNNSLDKKMETVLWEEERGGGGSYYVNQFGRSGVQMPWMLDEFYAMIRSADPDEFNYD
jgi:4-hydroxyacetophenone monooxygenase